MTNARNVGLVLAVAAAAAVLLALAACQKSGAVRPAEPPADQEVVEAEQSAPPEPAEPYTADVQPLSTEECSQCHLPVYNAIKEQGGKHKIDCVRCHTQYHVYNPRKQNFDEIMPKCDSCHTAADGGPYHGTGEALTPCLECHGDPHRPLAIPMERIDGQCGACHAAQRQEMEAHPSMHSDAVACGDCHMDEHGYVPECSTCHASHSPEVEMASADCMTCHPVHSPTRIDYVETTSSLVCAGCHQEPYEQLTHKVTKHSGVGCGECHPKHTEIDPCSKCHGQPHSSAMMQDTSKCNECHGIAHNLAAD